PSPRIQSGRDDLASLHRGNYLQNASVTPTARRITKAIALLRGIFLRPRQMRPQVLLHALCFGEVSLFEPILARDDIEHAQGVLEYLQVEVGLVGVLETHGILLSSWSRGSHFPRHVGPNHKNLTIRSRRHPLHGGYLLHPPSTGR